MRLAMSARPKTTTQRNLGWQHQQQRERLLRAHVDGSPCYWCNLPMFRDAASNFDLSALNADHSHARAHGGLKADRLLHGKCNKERGDGSRDHLRPAVTGKPIAQAQSDQEALGVRVMPWP
ncbi:hypothetical protein R3Q06_31440 [Rhodococcus erythropolis]|uniref:hypothetical protein n=1 Tax=Rhodococcus erythropolis TaxID=1833 RepID=UPI00294A8716|nr:hypothetical protein [Rhodococcus erythropolis]MDV6278000.1 hypothetical protein [Rhodococcus erythropolis]